MNAPLHHPVVPAAASARQEITRAADRAFWRQVVSEMNLRPGLSLGQVNADRLGTDAWRA